MPLATLIVFGLAVGGMTENVVAGVAVCLAVLAIVRFATRHMVLLAAAGAIFAGLGASVPREADALSLAAVPGGYALATENGDIVYAAEGRGAKRACLRHAAASGALALRVR